MSHENKISDSEMSQSDATSDPSEFFDFVNEFSGEEEYSSLRVHDFFAMIEEVSSLAGWNDRTKLMVASFKLTGRAANMRRKFLKSEKEYEVFKKKFIELFAPKENLIMMLARLMDCVQEPQESVVKFDLRIKALARYIGFLAKSDDLHYDKVLFHAVFVRGLKASIKIHVLRALTDETTYEQSFQKARQEEINEEFLLSSPDVDASAQMPEVKEMGKELQAMRLDMDQAAQDSRKICAKLEETKKQLQELNKRRKSGVLKSGHVQRCYRCGKIGHVIKNCWFNQK